MSAALTVLVLFVLPVERELLQGPACFPTLIKYVKWAKGKGIKYLKGKFVNIYNDDFSFNANKDFILFI